MSDALPDAVGATLDLAVRESVESDARSRISRLVHDRRPTTAASTGTWVNWSNASEILGQPFDMVRIPLTKLEQMRRDPMLAFGLMFVKVPLVRAPWYIRCTDPRIGTAVDRALRRIYGRFILAYTNSFDYGYSPMVKRFALESPDWEYVDKNSPDAVEQPIWTASADMMVWKPFTAINPRLAAPHWNSKGEFNGIDFTSSLEGGMSPFFNSSAGVFPSANQGNPRIADIPLDWAMWATNEKDSVFGSYWGYPRIGYSYRYWWAYWYRFGLADRAFEKWADPPIMAFHPASAGVDEDGNKVDFSAEALGVAEQLRAGANVSLPSSVVTGYDEKTSNVREWWLEQMESKADFEALNKAFEYLDVQKLRAVMVPEQALVEGRGGTSSRNVAATFGDVFQESQAVVKQEIDDHINRFMIPQFVEMNFGPNAPKAEIVTTGFDPQDIDTMREIVRLLGQENKGLTEVDTRELLERLGIPLMSYAAMQAKQLQEAEQAEAMRPDPVDPIGEEAGVTPEGLYYKGREVITLSDRRTPQPVFIERVENLGAPAMYEPMTRTLTIDKDVDLSKVQKYLLDMGESQLDPEGDVLPGLQPIHDMIEHMREKISELSEKETTIHVHVPEQPAPDDKKYRTRTEYLKDDDGFITGVVLSEEEVDDGETETA